MERWFDTWYNKYAVLVGILVLWMVGYYLIDWGKLNPSEWASWAQAVGSLVAIVAAFYIGERQARITLAAVREADQLAEAKRIESLIGMADIADAIARKCLEVYRPDGFFSLGVSMAQVDDPLEIVNIGLSGVPLHEVGSGHAVSALILLRTGCHHLERALDRAEEWRNRSEPSEEIIDWYVYDTGAIRLCCSNIQRSSENLSKALRKI